MSPERARLTLRAPRGEDEEAVRAAHDELARDDDFPFCLFFDPDMSWSKYLALLDSYRRGEHLPEGMVPSTLLVAEVDGAIVGRSSIRHALNDFLAYEGGHIGYCVRPAYRRRGYATAILRESLVEARRIGLGEVLVCCDDDNTGSASVIERCGGRLEGVVPSHRGDGFVRRYWIRPV